LCSATDCCAATWLDLASSWNIDATRELNSAA
jgi:hypothetical protein